MSCHCHTDIVRDGSGQLGRYLKALDPAYAPIDERSMEELLVFIKRYASQIRKITHLLRNQPGMSSSVAICLL